jgi:hypothetical protein
VGLPDGKHKTIEHATGCNPATFSSPLLAMTQNLKLFVLEKHSPQSYADVGDFQHAVSKRSAKTVRFLTKAVRDHIKSSRGSKSWSKDADHINFVVYQVRATTDSHRNPLTLGLCGQLPEDLQGLTAIDLAQRGQLDQNNVVVSNTALKTLGNSPNLAFVFGALF